MALPPVPGAFAVSTLGDADPEEGVLEGGAGGGEVDIIGLGGTFEGPFRFAPGFLGALEIDLARHVGRFRHDHDPIGPDLEEAADDRERLDLSALADAQFADAQHRDERRVVRQHAELALDSRELDRIDRIGIRQSLRRHDLQEEWHQILPASRCV
jgi:hypothetical protein